MFRQLWGGHSLVSSEVQSLVSRNDFTQAFSKVHRACIVYVYSPTCGACMSRTPTFNAMVKHLKPSLQKKVYAFDGSSNEASALFEEMTGLQIHHFPMILLVSQKGTLMEYRKDIQTAKEGQKLLTYLMDH